MDINPKLVSNKNTMVAADSKPHKNGLWKVWYLITLLKLSGFSGIRAHTKTIKIITEKFQRLSQ